MELSVQPPHLVREVLRHVWQKQGWPLGAMGFDEWNAVAEMASIAEKVPPGESRRKVFPGAILAEATNGQMRLVRQT